MTTMGDRSALDALPLGLVRLSRDVQPIGLVVPGAIRRALHELPAAVGRYPGRRPPCPVAPLQGGLPPGGTRWNPFLQLACLITAP